MILPAGLIVTPHTASIFTPEALMIKGDKIIPYAGNEDKLGHFYRGQVLPHLHVTQLYFEVNTMIEGANVIYGRGRWRGLVNIIKIDDERKWTTVQYISGKQRTVLLSACSMKNPHLVPVHFSCYEKIQKELEQYYSKEVENFRPDWLASQNYTVRIVDSTVFAWRIGLELDNVVVGGNSVEIDSVRDSLSLKTNTYYFTKKPDTYVPSKEMKDPGIINTHWADKLAIRMLEGQRDIIDKHIENIETKIFESENSKQ